MPESKISSETVRLIHDFDRQSKKPEEIAHILRLKPIHVRTILAAHANSVGNASSSVSNTSDVTQEAIVGAGREVIPEDRPDADTNETEAPHDALMDVIEEDLIEGDERNNDGIYLGEDEEYGDLVYWEPGSRADVPNPHLMIMGESGSGKTYSAQCLIAELAQKGMPSLVFDYGQSFELQHLEKPLLKFNDVKEHNLGDSGLPINPLQIFPNDAGGPRKVATRVSDVFDAVYKLGDIQRRVVIDAIMKSFRKVGIDDLDARTWIKTPPTLADLQQVLDELSADKSYPNAKNATGVAARMITFFMLGTASNAGWSWTDLLESDSKIHILQFRGLEGKTQRVLIEILLWHFFYFLKNRGQHALNVYCVLDEAHHISFREGGPVDSLLREARKFGLGVIFASQQPEDFSAAAFANSASKLVFQIADPTGKVSRSLSSKCSNYSSAEDVKRVVSQLKQGHAFFISKNKGSLVSVADLKKRATLWQQNL